MADQPTGALSAVTRTLSEFAMLPVPADRMHELARALNDVLAGQATIEVGGVERQVSARSTASGAG